MLCAYPETLAGAEDVKAAVHIIHKPPRRWKCCRGDIQRPIIVALPVSMRLRRKLTTEIDTPRYEQGNDANSNRQFEHGQNVQLHFNPLRLIADSEANWLHQPAGTRLQPADPRPLRLAQNKPAAFPSHHARSQQQNLASPYPSF